jgi:hypothetical protein
MERQGGKAMIGHLQHGGPQVMDMEMKIAPKSDVRRKGQQHKMYGGPQSKQ